MTRFGIARAARIALVASVALATAAVASGATSVKGGGARAAAGTTLVVDRSFEIAFPRGEFRPVR